MFNLNPNQMKRSIVLTLLLGVMVLMGSMIYASASDLSPPLSDEITLVCDEIYVGTVTVDQVQFAVIVELEYTYINSMSDWYILTDRLDCTVNEIPIMNNIEISGNRQITTWNDDNRIIWCPSIGELSGDSYSLSLNIRLSGNQDYDKPDLKFT